MVITDILKQIRKVKMDVLYLDLSSIFDIAYDEHIYYKYFGDLGFQRTILDLIQEVLITLEDKKRDYSIKVLQEELLLCISDLKDFIDDEEYSYSYLITYFYANTNHVKTEKKLPFFKLIFEFRKIELAKNNKDLLEDDKIAMLVKAESITIQVSKVTELLLKIEKEIDQYQKSICYISKQDNVLDDIYFTEGLSHEATIIQTDIQEENFMEEEVESKSFQLFNRIRKGKYNIYDLTIFLKEYTNSYDLELLKSLQYDLSFYLFLEKEKMESSFTPDDVDQAIEEHKQNGLEIPYIKRSPFEELTERQKEMRKKLPMSSEPMINKEALLFPYEFHSL